MRILNTTPHPVRFQGRHLFIGGYDSRNSCVYCGAWQDESDDVECVYEIEPCGTVISARPVEEPVAPHPSGAELVKTRFEPTPEAEEALSRLEKENPGAVIVGSIIAAQAFPGRVFALVPVEGFERVPPAEKRMRDDKFTVF